MMGVKGHAQELDNYAICRACGGKYNLWVCYSRKLVIIEFWIDFMLDVSKKPLS